MDHKTFKQDLTYTCKRFAKENKSLSVDHGFLAIEDGKLVAEESLGVLDALVLVKGYTPTPLMMENYHERWVDPQGIEHESNWINYQAFGFNSIDIIAEQANIAKSDLYAFLDGLENVEWLGSKNEFYEVGVYIREKFTPVGVRTEMLRTKLLERFPVVGGDMLKGFVVHTRPVPCNCKKTDAPTIVEIEYQLITSQEDFTVSQLHTGEFKARIFNPQFLWEPKEKGSKITIPPVYFSHSVFLSLEEARTKARELVESEFKFRLRKKGIEYTEEEVQGKLADIQEVMLP